MAKVGSAEIEFDLDTKGFETQIAQTEDELNKINRAFETTKNMKPYKGQEEDLKDLSLQMEKVKNKLVGLKAQQDKIDYGDSSNQLQKHDKSLSKIIKKVGKWALAVFGVRSAYQFVRQAASTIGQYDKKIGADIQYIRYALAFTLKPVVEWLVKAAYTILGYVGAIIERLTGYNIFKNSGVKQYEKSLKSSEKSSKKIKDNFSASFDEFNKVEKQDTGSASGSGFVGPSEDLSKLKNLELPAWLTKIIDFIKEHKDTILKVSGAILGFLTFNKAIGWLSPLKGFFGGLGGVVGKLGLIAGAIALIGASIKEWYEGKKAQDKKLDQLNEDGKKAAKEDAKNIKNMNELQDSLNYKKKYSNELYKKAKSWGAAVAGESTKLYESTKANIEQQNTYIDGMVERWKKGQLSKEEEEKLKDVLKEQKKYLRDNAELLSKHGIDTKDLKDKAHDYMKILYQMSPELRKQVEEELKMTGLTDEQVKKKMIEMGYLQDETEEIQKVTDKSGSWLDKVKGVADKLKLINDTDLEDKDMKINVKTDTTKANKSLSELAVGIATTLAGPLKAFGLTSFADKLLLKVKKWPQANGAIINQPGRGVPLGVPYGGEAGREGIIPLTDSQAMAQLGQEIGKWVAINNVIDVNMDSKRINRILQSSQNTSNFANNR